MQIFLIGFMGSGKTYTAKRLATLLQRPFLDLDAYIEKKGGQTIAKLFEFGGATQFRKIEQQALKEAIKAHPDHIIATGGGTPVYFDNLAVMKKNGLVIYLDVSTEIIYQRIKDSGAQRPLLQSLKGEDLKQYINNLLGERLEYYLQAHLAVESHHSEVDAAKEIAAYLNKMNGRKASS